VSFPVSLDELLAPLAALPGVGPKRAALLAKAAGGERVLDLLFHLPERIAERLRVAHPAQAPAEAECILRVTPTAIRPATSRLTNRRYVEVRTAEGVTIRILNGWLATVERQFPRGEARWVSGKVKPEGDGWSMANPDVARAAEDLPALEPIHRLTESLQRPVMAAAIRAALAVLAAQKARRRVAVLGDMRELGDHGPALHAGLAPDTAAAADLVFACGPLMRGLFDAIPPARRGAWAETSGALAPAVAAALRDGDAVLVKGSLGMRMAEIVRALDGAGKASP